MTRSPAPPAETVEPSVSRGATTDETLRKLEELIRTGSLRDGQRLGAERDLAVTFGVSRATVRAALAELESQRLVRRIPGRGGGTFISGSKVERDLSRIVGVPALLRDQGFVAGTKVLRTAISLADHEVSVALRLPARSLIVDIVRIRLADGSPISLEHARFPADRFPGLLDHSLGGSLYELLISQYQTQPDTAEEQIEVTAASTDEAEILGVAPGAPLLSIRRITTDTSGQPMEYSHDLFRGDRTRITVRTLGRPVRSIARSAQGKVTELQMRTV